MKPCLKMFLIKSGHLVINRIEENQIPFNLSFLETAVCCAEDDPYLLSWSPCSSLHQGCLVLLCPKNWRWTWNHRSTSTHPPEKILKVQSVLLISTNCCQDLTQLGCLEKETFDSLTPSWSQFPKTSPKYPHVSGSSLHYPNPQQDLCLCDNKCSFGEKLPFCLKHPKYFKIFCPQ